VQHVHAGDVDAPRSLGPAARRQQSEQRHAEHAFARPRLSNERNDLAGTDVEIDAAERAHDA
jgi:hypothetical protein